MAIKMHTGEQLEGDQLQQKFTVFIPWFKNGHSWKGHLGAHSWRETQSGKSADSLGFLIHFLLNFVKPWFG